MTITNEVRDVLRKVRDEVLTGPERWTQNTNARDAHGNVVGCDAPEATCWCLHGALYKVGADGRVFSDTEDALSSAVDSYGPAGYIRWQDASGRTFPEVRALLDKAIGD